MFVAVAPSEFSPAVIPGPERSEGARNPYPRTVVMDSGPAPSGASRNDEGRDFGARRANHPDPVQPRFAKYFASVGAKITPIPAPVLSHRRGGSRSSRSAGQDAMDAGHVTRRMT
jgi:hypothetical protein